MNSLQGATLLQLTEWQNAIVMELYRRAAMADAPPVPRAPWEQPAPRAPTELELLRAQLAEARASITPAPQPSTGRPPAMLGGQQIGPGTVIATQKTDPAYAQAFAQMPARFDHAPPVQGNGRGEGEAGFVVP